jgi:hypothetical protein
MKNVVTNAPFIVPAPSCFLGPNSAPDRSGDALQAAGATSRDPIRALFTRAAHQTPFDLFIEPSELPTQSFLFFSGAAAAWCK